MRWRRRSRDIALLDRVHEHISLPPLIVEAVDTAAFQRLRHLKQLGASSFLYPGASHTRFEHSLGVAHMARRLLIQIQDQQPELQLTRADIECSMLAGLFHDIGHGPFSHLFEDVITRRCAGDRIEGPVFDHERMSQLIARRVMADELKLSDDEVRKVLQIMEGRCSDEVKYGELISNKRSGIDVDRLDYLIRDSMCCFGKPPVDVRVNRIFHSARLVCCDAVEAVASTGEGSHDRSAAAPPPCGQWQFAFEEKLALSLRELFALRAKLHKSVYQHQVVKAVGHIIGDVFFLAEPFFRVHGLSLTECAQEQNLDAFLHLGDWILEAIEASDAPPLAPARNLIHRLRIRDLYRIAFSRTLSPHVPRLESGHRLAELLIAHADPAHPLDRSAFLCEVVVINQGMGSVDPLRNVRFYNPKQPNRPPRVIEATAGATLFTPSVFEERTLMVFDKTSRAASPEASEKHFHALRVAGERLVSDPEFASYFTDSVPFYNPQ